MGGVECTGRAAMNGTRAMARAQWQPRDGSDGNRPQRNLHCYCNSTTVRCTSHARRPAIDVGNDVTFIKLLLPQ